MYTNHAFFVPFNEKYATFKKKLCKFTNSNVISFYHRYTQPGKSKHQEEYRLLKAKLEEKNKEGEGNEYTIFRNKIVKRTEVPNLTHKLKQAEGTNWASNVPIGGNSGGAALNAEKKNDSSE